MPRPVTWLPRLHLIRSSVQHSVRSHYDRRDLELLFELQPRAAQKLLELLPTVQIGTSRLVEREVLALFLERVKAADDTATLFAQLRQERSAPSRRKTRSLVRRADRPVSLASLPETIGLARGHLEVSFRSIEQLAEAMYIIARLLEDEGDAFAAAYEPETEPKSQDTGDVRELFAELEAMEASVRASSQTSAQAPETQPSQGLSRRI
jgi:hypothetical protein